MAETVTRPLAGQISVWIQNRVREANAKGVVFGMSGGIDSSVVAALAKMACGENILGMIMPCHSNPKSASDANIVARKLGIKTHVSDLTATYDTLVPRIPHAEGIELTNVRPRLRMAALYCAAQSLGYLVMGTSNKTEMAIGYFTKWGDGACDIQPIANLYKHQVYALARELDIPEEVISKPPTADLWDGQTDENEIGMTYDELDSILEAVETGEISLFPSASVERVRKMMAASEHKRCRIPAFEP
ncbi:MAG: NAD+ synthase [Armatimonadetes bacterium]|nr:NAD+ synthase [Armatimonadota bacterium]